MVFSRLLSPTRSTLLLVAILSAAQQSVSAPTADIGTAVSSAPKPLPNPAPGNTQSFNKEAGVVPSALDFKDEIKRRELNLASGRPAISKGVTPDLPPKRLGKRQFQQMSVSAPAILSRPPDAPNTNAEEDAIGAAAEKIKQAADDAVNHMEQVANAAVRNAAEEQRDGIDNPNFHGSQDNSYVWPSAAASQPAWPTNVASTWDPLASARAVAAGAPGGQGFQVLDGTGNPIQDNALQPERYIEPVVVNQPDAPLQVLDGNGNPIRDNALQPEAVVGPEQYFDPTLFDEPSLQVLDGTGNPIQNNALQPEAVIDVTAPDQNVNLEAPVIIQPEAPIQVLDGNGNPIRDNALQPEQVVEPLVVNQPEQIQILDGNGNPIRDNALQPEAVIGGPEQYFDPTLFDEPFQVLDGMGNPISGNALQPEATTPGYFTPDENQILNDVGQTSPGQTLQNADPSVIPAIVSSPDLWRQVLDDPNIQQFLRDNTPEGLQPLLDPSTKNQLEQDPNVANSLVPSLNNPTPDKVAPFLNLLDTLPLDDKLNLVNEGPDIARIAQTDPTELASVVDTIDNLRSPDSFPDIGGFRNNFFPPPSVHTDSSSMLFTPNGFEMSPVGPFGQPRLLPQLDGINQNFDGSINQQPSGPNEDIFGGTSGAIPTNVFLPNGGTISFNCVPIYIDANGEQHAASDIPSQILSAFNVGDMPMPITTQSSFTDQTTDPNTPLTPFLSEVVSQNPDILSASQIDEDTVLVNTKGGDDAEKVFSKLGNGWGMEAEDTDGQNGLDTITLENGGTKFQISQPQGFATADVLEAKTPGDILSKIGDGASIELETANFSPVPPT
ncbi:hypothetical protein TWF481_008386 [Arthrobotrys musiformis]|uniref:Uncharacterized protein n=1 Tax=Arthrobotrys musiformis TaxID=47236 RepID=A0AAV9W6Z7_9PEZI